MNNISRSTNTTESLNSEPYIHRSKDNRQMSHMITMHFIVICYLTA